MIHADPYSWGDMSSTSYGKWNIEDGQIRLSYRSYSFRLYGTAVYRGGVLECDLRGGATEIFHLKKIQDPDEIRRLESRLKTKADTPRREDNSSGK